MKTNHYQSLYFITSATQILKLYLLLEFHRIKKYRYHRETSAAGWRYNNGSHSPETMVPLETFEVRRGGKYRFRLISAAMAYPFRVSIDRHLLHVISTDGNDVMTTPVVSIVIQSGERYNFWIDARDPTLNGNYWIRVETMEHFHHHEVQFT